MRKLFSAVILLLVLGLSITYQKEIVNYIAINFIYNNVNMSLENNNYSLNNDFLFVRKTTNNIPSNKQDILNIIYTNLDNGNLNFTFICPLKYSECVNDTKTIIDDQELLSSINNFIHPYNSFKNIKINIDNVGKLDFEIDRFYQESDIIVLNNKIDLIINEVIKENMNDKDKILAIHNYIINNTKFDVQKSDAMLNNIENNIYRSDNAYGPLINGYGICSGYTDATALFLNKLNIKNYKISSKNHIWNFVNIDNNWYHLDLTWDDPVTDTGKEYLMHTYFLINSNSLKELKDGNHIYNENIYLEAK